MLSSSSIGTHRDMTENCRGSQGHTKDCLVVLNRLDEKLLKRFLRRKKDSKRKRRKVKPLCYTDDEDDPVETKHLKKCSENYENGQVDSWKMKDEKQESKEVGCELGGKVEQTKEELKVESSSSPSGGTGYCSAVDNKVEISKEFPRSFPGNITCDKAICDEKFIAQDDSGNDFDDMRDDDEDDRSTIIFEKEAYVEEFFKLEEKEMSNNLKKKKITNRKKQRLVKFKRKTMNGRNLGKIRKSKSKLFESGSGGLSTMEKSVSDCIPEDSLREVCISVRRLHEMYTIILQLQKEMPKDTELSYHFKRVINAQLENFHKEIRKSQKVVIMSFEKMLKPSCNTLDKVASDIGNRTFLTSEDVIYVLSLCILSEGSYDVDKSRNGSLEKTEQPKSSPGTLWKLGITKKAPQGKSYKSEVQHKEVVNIEAPSAAPASRTPIPSVTISHHQVEPQSQAPVAFVPNCTVQTSRACPQPFSYYQPYQRSYFWGQQNYESVQINNSGVRQLREVNPPQVVRQSAPSNHLPSTRSHYYNVPYTSQNTLYPARPRPPSNCTFYPTLGHHQRGGNLSPVQVQTSGPPIHLPSQTQYNYVPDRPNTNQTFGSPVLVPNTVGYGDVPNGIPESYQPVTVNSVPRITQERRSLPNLEDLSCNVDNGEIIPSPTSESQCRLNLTHSVGYYNSTAEKPVQERLTVPAVAGYSSTETNSIANTVPEVLDLTDTVPEVLDPTVPQRLTMKDCRLQAEPILDDAKSSEEEETERSAVESPTEELSRSRTYTCAEDGCENPGVRICNFCRSVIYCSKTCQEKHWDLKHKDECSQLKELRG